MVLQFNSHMKELNRLKKLNKEFNEFVNVGEQKRYVSRFTETVVVLYRAWFMGLSVEEKAERIIRVIQEIVQDVSHFMYIPFILLCFRVMILFGDWRMPKRKF